MAVQTSDAVLCSAAFQCSRGPWCLVSPIVVAATTAAAYDDDTDTAADTVPDTAAAIASYICI